MSSVFAVPTESGINEFKQGDFIINEHLFLQTVGEDTMHGRLHVVGKKEKTITYLWCKFCAAHTIKLNSERAAHLILPVSQAEKVHYNESHRETGRYLATAQTYY